MKGLFKRLGAMLLVLTLFTQCFGSHVYAAPNDSVNTTVSGNAITEAEAVLNDTEVSEEDEEITRWIEENILSDIEGLSSKPQEWWDGLTENQRLAAEIFLTPAAEECMLHYHEQPLDDVIAVIEKGDLKIEDFFADTIFTNITIENLYELKELDLTLDDLAEAIFGIKEVEGYEFPETDEMLIMAITVSGYSPFNTFDTVGGVEGNPEGGITHISTSPTGYTDGLGNNFWKLTENGHYVYCLDHGKSCSRTYEYGNQRQSTGKAEYLIAQYGSSANSTEMYMTLQMAIWACRAGQSASSAYTYAFSWFILGGMDRTKAMAYAQATKNWMIIAEGQSGTCYVVSGPAGSQDIGGGSEFRLTGTPGEPTPPEEVPEPIIVDVPSIDNFYIEKEARTEYHVELTKESIITNETLEGFKFKVVESEADGHDLTYDFITGEYAEEGQDYEEATINSDSFGQTTPESITVPYMDDDVKPSGGKHETTITTNENGYAETTFVHEATFKEFYSICYDQSMGEIDVDTYNAMLEEAIATLSGAAAGVEIIVNYRGGSTSYTDAAEPLALCTDQQTVYTQTIDVATATVEELYDAYCDRTYKYTVTEIDGYTRPGSTDSNGKVLPEIKLPKLGFRKNVKDATTISSYTKTLADGQTMVAGGKNDADSNTEE